MIKSEKLNELVALYGITISHAEVHRKHGESQIKAGIETLKKGDEEYHQADIIRKQIQELGETGVIK